ncbi:MAG: ABC-F family ATP-binding cassette domain-containing protein [Treponema sp.]|jgi:ATP-binding cassette subfamily F protein 3|nr:ABC-F family ATP-binding cassette domain-containing protein [Treponema sp.]
MAFVQFSKVSLAFGDRDILKIVSLNLAAGSRACLAGANGSGKSTLMKVIAGLMAADSGDRSVQKGTRVSYLPQSGIVHRGKSLRDEAETAFAPVQALLLRAEELGVRLASAKSDDRSISALVEEHHRLQEQVENSGYYRREAVISMTLDGLGFSPNDLDRETGEFSGGWQMRIALAKTLLEQPDILLLDEPTNYLDIEARSWLEGWLKNFPGGCLLVSHDRYFLDVTINEVYELFQGDLKRCAGNYSAYEKTRQAELAALLKHYEEQQEEIAKTEALIRRFRYKASKAAFAQELIKRLEKMERIEIPESLKKISITFPPPPHSGRIALTLEGIGKCYGGRQVLSGLGLLLESGERLVVAGPNGAGKSTLLRIIAGVDGDFSGSVQYGAGISAGYFSQDAAEAMQGSEQVIEFMEACAPTALIPKVRDMLGAFLFRGDDVYKSVSVLSGGEKSRLALLRMFLKPLNLLILDEPTNHLDLHSKDILLSTLRRFEGTIIFVSHDRAFMEALSTKTLELAPNVNAPAGARLFYGNYAYYLDRITQEDQEGGRPPPRSSPAAEGGKSSAAPLYGALPRNAPAPLPENAAVPPLPKTILIKQGETIPLTAGERREKEKQRQTRIRRLARQEAEIITALEQLEAEKSRVEAELSRPEVYSSGETAKAARQRLEQTAANIAAKTAEWETTAAELEAAQQEM